MRMCLCSMALLSSRLGVKTLSGGGRISANTCEKVFSPSSAISGTPTFQGIGNPLSESQAGASVSDLEVVGYASRRGPRADAVMALTTLYPRGIPYVIRCGYSIKCLFGRRAPHLWGSMLLNLSPFDTQSMSRRLCIWRLGLPG